jgi:hypothetical protein
MSTALKSSTLSWQIQTDDIDQILYSIQEAANRGVDRIQLSHRVIHTIEELWYPKPDSAIQQQGQQHFHDTLSRIIAFIRERNLKVDIWTHEISGATKEEIASWKNWKIIEDWLTKKYNKAFKIIPEIDGLVLTLAETDFSIYNQGDAYWNRNRKGLASELPWLEKELPVDRIANLLSIMHNICRMAKKTLIVRTFVYQPDEIQCFVAAVNKLGKEKLNGGDLIFMSKCTPHDWQPFYPWNPDIGQLPHQWVEIDHGQEYSGQSLVMRDEVNYTKAMIDHALNNNVEGFVTRIERYQNPALGTPNELNLYALTAFLKDPSQTPQSVKFQWIKDRFTHQDGSFLSNEVSNILASLLERTYQVTNVTLFPLRNCIMNHSQLPDQSYVTNRLTNYKTSKWIANEQNDERLDHPNDETLSLLKIERREAKALVQDSLNDLEGIRDNLGEHYVYFKKFLPSRNWVKVFKTFQLAIFGARYYQQLSHDSPKKQALKQQVICWINKVRAFENNPEIMEYFATIRSRVEKPLENFFECCDELEKMVDPKQ